MVKKLHIVALNIPYPPDYGGVIDIFYRIKALHQIGVEIILHCFKYNRPESTELNKYCTRVFYYERKMGIFDFFSRLPFIVATRNHPLVLENILCEPAPVLFDGIHCCYFLSHEKLKDVPKIVRTHNVEHHYYRALMSSTKSPFKRFYFQQEARKLQPFEKELKHASALACISPGDTSYFSNRFKNAHFVPAFHPFEEVVSIPGKGSYILFHGNLSVPENEKALDFILNEILPHSHHPLIVAGKNPSEKIRKRMATKSVWQLIENPSGEEMHDLILQAQICLIPTFQSTGLKLKLMASLFAGKFVAANPEMVDGTGVEELVLVGKSAKDLLGIVNKAMAEDFTSVEIEKRKSILYKGFSNKRSAQSLVDLIANFQKQINCI